MNIEKKTATSQIHFGFINMESNINTLEVQPKVQPFEISIFQMKHPVHPFKLVTPLEPKSHCAYEIPFDLPDRHCIGSKTI